MTIPVEFASSKTQQKYARECNKALALIPEVYGVKVDPTRRLQRHAESNPTSCSRSLAVATTIHTRFKKFVTRYDFRGVCP
jgi:hypothetical protein